MVSARNRKWKDPHRELVLGTHIKVHLHHLAFFHITNARPITATQLPWRRRKVTSKKFQRTDSNWLIFNFSLLFPRNAVITLYTHRHDTLTSSPSAVARAGRRISFKSRDTHSLSTAMGSATQHHHPTTCYRRRSTTTNPTTPALYSRHRRCRQRRAHNLYSDRGHSQPRCAQVYPKPSGHSREHRLPIYRIHESPIHHLASASVSSGRQTHEH